MIVLEGQEPLGDAAHAFYDEMIKKLEADNHARRARSGLLERSADRRRARRATTARPPTSRSTSRGNQGESLANESVEAVQKIVDGLHPPAGVKAYVTGPAALPADQHIAGDRSMQLIESGHVHRHHRHAAAGLPVDRHGAAHAGDGGARTGRRARLRRVPRLPPDHRALDVRDQPARHPGDSRGHGLRHLPDRPISGGRGVSARTENRRTTRCSAARRTWCWARA